MSDDFPAAAAQFPDPFRLLIRETAASTNDEARQLGEKGSPHGLVVLALHQLAGRGRRGAAWFSPAEKSLAFSILIRPTEPKALWPRLALAAGLAVAEAVESFGAPAGIKWPNDVWIRRRKVAGILVEAGNDFAVVGIGINVNTVDFPPEVAEIATSIGAEAGSQPCRHEVLTAVIHRFAHHQSQIGVGFADLIESVRQRCVLTGHRVSLLSSAGPRQGTIHGIAPGGELIFGTPKGMEHLIQADEIRLLDEAAGD
jgi:BirA family transcriptional regulator, biotin operon repressor / biotin---[acetyl-CoA-carboxylase] ligase